MNQQYDIKASSFLLWWMACAVMVWPLALICMGLILFPLGTIFNGLGLSSLNPGAGLMRLAYELVTGLAVAALLGGIIGFSVGQLQRWLLTTRLYWVAENWRMWSIAGGALGGIACLVLAVLMPSLPYVADENAPLLLMPVFMAGVSALQWRSLRHVVKHAWLWILANISGGVIFAGLIMMNLPPEYSLNYSLGVVGLWLLATLVQGLVTGFIMLHLFESHPLPMENAHADGSTKDNEPSIWDKAI
jgi:hypothetical protein